MHTIIGLGTNTFQGHGKSLHSKRQHTRPAQISKVTSSMWRKMRTNGYSEHAILHQVANRLTALVLREFVQLVNNLPFAPFPSNFSWSPLLLVAILSGCAASRGTMTINEPFPLEEAERNSAWVFQASMTATSADASKPFVGIALSGGGSRAANFSWAVMEKLHEIGLLQHVDAISSVSGGSLASALYALNLKNLVVREDWQRYREKLRHDFLGDWLRRLLNPFVWFRLISSEYDRTSVMAEVFDDTLFNKATYSNLRLLSRDRPRLFLNATRASDPLGPRPFIFTDEGFSNLGSRLDTFPIAHAVMASGAFPGVFGHVTLKDFTETTYDPTINAMKSIPAFERLYDGGPSDNLGIWTLLKGHGLLTSNPRRKVLR